MAHEQEPQEIDFITAAPVRPVDELDAPFTPPDFSGGGNPWNLLSTSPDITDHFPFPQIRPAQADILEAFMRGQAKRTKNIIIEAPTGIGKSALAFAMASWTATNVTNLPEGMDPGAFLLTTQKSLQDQYMGDFADKGMVELRGVANYPCDFRGTDCAQGRHIDAAEKQMKEPPPPCKDKCPYVLARNEFMDAPISLTNFAYFLTVISKIKLFKKRPLLILDEAHNTEMQILSMQSVEVTVARAKELNVYPMPFIEEGHEGDFYRAVDWCRDKLLPAIKEHISTLKREMGGASSQTAAGRLAGKIEGSLQLMAKIMDFCGQETKPRLLDWIVFTEKKTQALTIKPLDASKVANTLLDMGSQVVFMSATILDPVVFARSLGLERETCGFKRLDSEFPVKNRLLHYQPCGSMSYKNKDATLPKWLRGIERVCRENPDTKGLIHCQSYDLANRIADHLEDTAHGRRIITHAPGVRGAREDAIREHIESKEPTILLSPSMTEGLDLKGDLSRWQIISKVPYPSIGDPFIKAKKARDEKWYSWMTALALTQATGRSVRSASDYASTYILDSDFEKFMNYSGSFFPKWWTDAIVWE